MEYINEKPFLKWAGGKRQLLSEIRNLYPDKIDKYCEPFVGAGTILFDVVANYHPKQVMINDINKELINTYIQLRDHSVSLIHELERLQKLYLASNETAKHRMYMDKRNRFNYLKLKGILNLEMAALFIFLNRTCFNGLYRVNKSGQFNVPIGSYNKPLICDVDTLRHISTLLSNVQIKNGSYTKCKDFIDKDTFVFFDPPYRPLSKTSSFVSYASSAFSDKEQISLANFVKDLDTNGTKIVLCNSDPKNVDENDEFFDELYKGLCIMRVSANRNINSSGTKRGKITEILVSN